ncbi:MAG: Osmosensitive channel signal transduction histidine kinase, partial [Verrucomicrobiales bacterium]|nr:Osmosensitive channel signal transduction histidine kinase [Verrucomicrobiales bacterium]
MNDDADDRPDPDALLAQLHEEDHASKAGRLHIYLGMCPGVGKTFAMLQAARQQQKEGRKVLAGVIETHGRAETAALLEGLERLPLRHSGPSGAGGGEFDLDAALRLKPDLILVDELAHTNAPGSRHAKRYQDVLELLDMGINVLTTLNVQHIESQVDIVQQITGITIQERVPDSILDRAHEIQLIDLGVEKLLERLTAGKIYLGDRADTAARNFFKESNLTALREMALRFTAEQVDRDLEDIRRFKRISSAWKTNSRLLVGIGPSPYAESLIRWTRRAAARLGCPWLVVWVEGSRQLSPADQDRLGASLALARQLGAEVISVTGENVAAALLQLARERNVSQMVVGKPDQRRWWRRSLADHLIDESGDIDVCAVRPLPGPASKKPDGAVTSPEEDTPAVLSYSMALAITFLIVTLGTGLLPYTGYVFIGLTFLLVVTLAGLWLRRGPVLLMAALSALSWNFFFIEPRFTFFIGKLQDMFMFGLFFIVALSMGNLTTRLRQREKAETQRRKLTAALLRVTQSAALSAEPIKGLSEAIRTINEVLHAECCLVTRNEDHVLDSSAHPASTFKPPPKEWGVASWSYQNRKPAGRFTDTLPQSFATWFPLQTSTAIMGVIGIRLADGVGLDFGKRQAIEA